jgi:tRNA U34 5-carboxymethylaminomethyl modifying GTPase MnmE/TrmE
MPNSDVRSAGFEEAEQRRQRLLGVATEIGAVANLLGLADAAAGIDVIARRVDSDSFVVMILGDFKRGKSTFINALLGAHVLPSFPWPCTAVLTEVRWGPEPAAMLFPRANGDGVSHAGEPTPVSELEQRIVIDVDSPEQHSSYERAEVYWPLELCQNNVVIVDSPGLNEDPIRERLTLDYLTRTDAVIFVQDAQANMSMSEAHFLGTYLGSHDPFFVFNKINLIPESQRDKVQRAAMVRLHRVRPDQAKDDDRRVFWVDALSGIEARLAGDAQRWESSAMALVERALENYLANERHKIKIMVPARELRVQRKDLAESILAQQQMLGEDLEELTRRYEAAQTPLRLAETDANRIAEYLRNRMTELHQLVERRVTSQLERLAEQVPDWAVESVPESKLRMLPTKVQEQAEAVAKEIASLTARRVEQAFAEWFEQEFAGELTGRITDISRALDHEVEVFEEGVLAIRLDMTGISSESAAGGAADGETPLSRLLAGVGGLVLAGPAAGLAGLRLGPADMLKTVLPALAIAVVWMATPFGWPILAAALLAQGLFQANFLLDRAQEKIKKQVGVEMAKQLRLRASANARQAADELDKQFLVFQQAVEQGLQTQLANIRQEVEAVLAAKREGENTVARRRSELDLLSKRLDEAVTALNEIVDDIAVL